MAVIFLVPLFVLLVRFGGAPFADACFRDTRKVYKNLHGYYFEIVDTDCDIIAKTASIDVYARSIGVRKLTRLFQYDPTSYDAALPDIQVTAQNEIIITVPVVSSVSYQRTDWVGRTIRIEIGKNIYEKIHPKLPTPGPSP